MESDVLSLSPGLTLDAHTLYDYAVGARHRIHPSAQTVVAAVRQGVSYASLRALAARHALTESQVAEVLGFMNTIGALRRKRHLRGRLSVQWRTLCALLIGIRYPGLAWRRPASGATVCQGLLRACWPVLVAAAGVSILAGTSGVVSAAAALGGGGYFICLFVASLVAHEIAHVMIIIKNGTQPIVLQRGMRIGIVYGAVSPGSALRSALAGPASGIVCCGVGAALAGLAGYAGLAGLGAGMSVFHLGSLLPWYGDGAAVKHYREQV